MLTGINGGFQPWRRCAGEKRGKKHLAQNVLGLGRAASEMRFGDGTLKFRKHRGGNWQSPCAPEAAAEALSSTPA
ncbi:MAG TPA: hypothetical protein VGC09_15535 [Rhodopila sp.]